MKCPIKSPPGKVYRLAIRGGMAPRSARMTMTRMKRVRSKVRTGFRFKV